MEETETGAQVEAETGPEAPAFAQLWRTLLTWAGLITLAILTILATVHLFDDISAVVGIRGGLSSVVGRLLPVAILSFIGLGLVVVVHWLAGMNWRRELVAIGIGMTVLVVIRVFLAYEFDGASRGEPAVYNSMAESFLTSDPDRMSRPPGYGWLLAGAYAVISDRVLATEALNLLLAVLLGGVVWGLTRSHFDGRVAVVALMVYALWPAAALMTVVRLPHIAFDLTIAAAAWATLGTVPGWKGSALTGAALAGAQYLRPTAPILIPAYLVARWWPGAPWQRQALTAVVMVVAFLVLMLPMMVSNYERSGSPSFSTSDFGGHTLYIGTYEPSGGQFSQEASDELIERAGPDPADRSALGMELAIERILDDPVGMAALAVRKQDTLWGTEGYGVQYAIKQSLRDAPRNAKVTTPLLLSQGFYVLVLAAAFVGGWLRRREGDALLALATLVIWAATATHALLEVRDRHHAFAVVLLLPLAAYAVSTLLTTLEREVRNVRAR